MCPQSCTGYTGPYSQLTECPGCSSPCYQAGTENPQWQFTTIPPGPVIQAMYCLEDATYQVHYRDRKTEEILEYVRNNRGHIKVYDDTMCGRDYLEAWQAGKIKMGDILLQLSWDGTQLYRDKESDCLLFMFLSHNPPPYLQHTKNFVIPGGTIPGPNKPKITKSFLFLALYHIAALQNEGLKIWDASTKCQRTPQSTSHYSRHLRQSPIHPSAQATVVRPTWLTYVSDLRVRPTCQAYVASLRIHPTCPIVGPHYYFNYLSPLTPY